MICFFEVNWQDVISQEGRHNSVSKICNNLTFLGLIALVLKHTKVTKACSSIKASQVELFMALFDYGVEIILRLKTRQKYL